LSPPRRRFFEILVPSNVVLEWRSAPKNWPDSLAILDATVPDPMLRVHLDLGEASVIESALQHHVAQVLIDEQKARKVARNLYGLTVVGTARILVELCKAGRIGALSPLFSSLRASSYWIDESIVNWALRSVGEKCATGATGVSPEE
jgi:predicted nucleic acid-binding protein